MKAYAEIKQQTADVLAFLRAQFGEYNDG